MDNNLSAEISGFVCGDRFQVNATLTNVPAGATVTKCWLTVRVEDDPNSAMLFQKIVTIVDVPGVGLITNPGSGTPRVAAARFDIMPVDSVLLLPVYENTTFYFDIQALLSTGALDIYTPVKGTIWGEPQITTDVA